MARKYIRKTTRRRRAYRTKTMMPYRRPITAFIKRKSTSERKYNDQHKKFRVPR